MSGKLTGKLTKPQADGLNICKYNINVGVDHTTFIQLRIITNVDVAQNEAQPHKTYNMEYLWLNISKSRRLQCVSRLQCVEERQAREKTEFEMFEKLSCFHVDGLWITCRRVPHKLVDESSLCICCQKPLVRHW